ncbi:DUF4347 domain-containing protein [Trichothermofontia sp.]
MSPSHITLSTPRSTSSQLLSFDRPARRRVPPHSLVFIDPGVDAYQLLAAGVQPGVEVVVLNPNEDGIAQISQHLLQQPQRVTSLHLVSHGEPGRIWLGATCLALQNLMHYARQIHDWSYALAESAELLIYGCHVARERRGQIFVQQLSRLTGARVSASLGLTGHADLGGDWELAYRTGPIRSPLAFQRATLQNYPSVLATIIDDGDSGFLQTGVWSLANGIGFNNDLRSANAGDSSDLALWTFTGLVPGSYRVSATWVTRSGAASNAPFTLSGGTPLTVNVDQRANPSGVITDGGATFQDILGSYTIVGNSLTVQLANNANGVVIADAVRIEPLNVNVIGTNQPPVNVVPGTQVTRVNTPLVFSPNAGNGLTVTDPDAGNNPVLISLIATNGTVTLNGTNGLSFRQGEGDGVSDRSMIFNGTLANVNAALNGLRFDPDPNFSGAATLSIATNDLGNTGTGGPLVDTDIIGITVGNLITGPGFPTNPILPPGIDISIPSFNGPFNQILGTNGNDTIRGTSGHDEIYGYQGNDSLIGNQGRDRIFGGQENDTLHGGKGDDTLYGGKQRDRLFGDEGNDVLRGDLDNDTLFGGQGNDTLFGGKENDILHGDRGNDTLSGDNGNDTLDGSNEKFAGFGEIDVLIGGSGSDFFILGNRLQAYYDDGNPNSAGIDAFARIADFNLTEDFIQLRSGLDYYIGSTFNTAAIYINNDGTPGTSSNDELIAVLDNVSPAANITPRFIFV